MKTEHTFDKLLMYFGDPYKITEDITIFQPTIGDILTYGEKDFFHMLSVFIGNPTSFRVALWKAGIDWTQISDFELFIHLIVQSKFEPNKTRIIFGDLNFSELLPYKRTRYINEEKVEDVILSSQNEQIIIDEEIYEHISAYLRTLFNIFPKVEKAKGKTTKIWMIEEEMAKNEISEHVESTLLPMVSFCLNHPGFKYKKNELKDMGIYEFNDSVQRLLIYESTSSLMKGMYSGFVDTSKIDKKEFNFMREIIS